MLSWNKIEEEVIYVETEKDGDDGTCFSVETVDVPSPISRYVYNSLITKWLEFSHFK